MPQYSVDQIIAASQGTKPWYALWKSGWEWVKQLQGDVANVSGGSPPGFGGAIDFRQDLVDTAGSPTAYVASPTPAPDPADTITAGAWYRFTPSTANSGDATLNIGSAEGAVSFRKVDATGVLVPLDAGDFVPNRPVHIRHNGSVWVVYGLTVATGGNVGALMAWAGREVDIPDRWYACDGRSLGNAASGAGIASDDLEPAHEILKHWSPNAGTEVWGTDLIEIPDFRGRTLIGPDNLGGTPANRVTAAAADVLGGTGGAEAVTLTTSEMPVHGHTTSSNGNHAHSPSGGGMFGLSTDSSKEDINGSSGGWATWGRNTWTTTTGNHTHTINNTGGGSPHDNMPPWAAAPILVYLGV